MAAGVRAEAPLRNSRIQSPISHADHERSNGRLLVWTDAVLYSPNDSEGPCAAGGRDLSAMTQMTLLARKWHYSDRIGDDGAHMAHRATAASSV